ncbi:hypothetical protein [Sporomusa malonica]|uniref:Uncharacterized protein n=1 Tax=Sporomusa malonica TaxID=112901 RepID=A0A1W2ESU7_9FIRM|nr:hypothetical protein [Sporomusa malonica]SMD12790.1 hypothetical protein SAMN04488500_12944 [Sporomusa malonica]
MISLLRGLRWLLCLVYLLIVFAILDFLPADTMEVAVILFVIVGFCGYRILFVGDGTSIF